MSFIRSFMDIVFHAIPHDILNESDGASEWINFQTCVQKFKICSKSKRCYLDFHLEEIKLSTHTATDWAEELCAKNHLIQLTRVLSVHTLWLNAIITCCEPEVSYAQWMRWCALFAHTNTHSHSHLINLPKQSKHRNNPQRVLYVIAFCHISLLSRSFSLPWPFCYVRHFHSLLVSRFIFQCNCAIAPSWLLAQIRTREAHTDVLHYFAKFNAKWCSNGEDSH